MKKTVFALFLSIAAFALLVGCGGGGSSSPTTGTLKLNIVDNSDVPVPVSGATIIINGKAETENTSTHLRENVDAGKAFIKVSKSGYLATMKYEPVKTGYTTVATITLVVTAGNIMTSTIDLTTAQPAVEFKDAQANKRVTIDFPALDDATASQTVDVFHNQPTDDKDVVAFPGVFMGVPTGETEEVPFETYGYVNVNLNGASIPEGKVATVTIYCDADTAVVAPPATMPLWYFDETEQKWKQEGNATWDSTLKAYIAQVSHFSWYNLDRPLGNDVQTLEVYVASYTQTYDHENWEAEPDLTKANPRMPGCKVTVRASFTSTGEWAQEASGWSSYINNTSWLESQITDSEGKATFRNIPAGRNIQVDVVSPDGEERGGGSYYVKTDGSAYMIINYGSFSHGTFNKKR